MNNAPCMGCTERHPHCHSECARYKEFKESREVVRKKRLEAIECQEVIVRGICRMRHKAADDKERM